VVCHGAEYLLNQISSTVQPDAVCEVGGSTPDHSYGDLGIFLGGGQTENLYTS